MESYEYDAWGRVLGVYDSDGTPINESAVGNNVLWQGREYSWKTGLYNFRARWYDPITGRWLSKDPIGISGGLNQYVFCGNNPVNFVDPLGLYIWQTQYWADRSIRGGWLNRSFSTVMGVLAATVPDVATVEVRGLAAKGGGVTAGQGLIINVNDNSIRRYDTRGWTISTKQVSLSLGFSIAWSDQLAPSSKNFEGKFHEAYGSMEWLYAGGYFGGEWKGVGAGLTADISGAPGSLSYQRVDYEMQEFWMEGDADTCRDK